MKSGIEQSGTFESKEAETWFSALFAASNLKNALLFVIKYALQALQILLQRSPLKLYIKARLYAPEI